MSTVSLSQSLEGLAEVRQRLAALGEKAPRVMAMVINRGADRARTRGVSAIAAQVKLQKSYIRDLLAVSKKASKADPDAVITGRKRPTLLFRYGAVQRTVPARNGKRRKAGVSVNVKRKSAPAEGKWFIVHRLKNSGASAVISRFRRSSGVGNRWDGLKVLYGPSVDQLWRDVRDDVAPEVMEWAGTELVRQLERDDL